MGTSGTKSIIKYWSPSFPNDIKVCTSAKFNDSLTYLPDGSLSPGCLMSSGQDAPSTLLPVTVDLQPSPLLPHPIIIKSLTLPHKGYSLHFTVAQCSHHNMPFVVSSKPLSFFYQGLPATLRHNTWILAIGNNEALTSSQVLADIARLQENRKRVSVTFVLSK